MTEGGRRCAICREKTSAGSGWFLLVENRWEDRLKIVQWNTQLAKSPGVAGACGIGHVEQLVAHWMATGSLGYPFALSGPQETSSADESGVEASEPVVTTSDLTQAKVLSEIAIDRAALRRVLQENPLSLVSMLEALLQALDGDEWQNTIEPEVETWVAHTVSPRQSTR